MNTHLRAGTPARLGKWEVLVIIVLGALFLWVVAGGPTQALCKPNQGAACNSVLKPGGQRPGKAPVSAPQTTPASTATTPPGACTGASCDNKGGVSFSGWPEETLIAFGILMTTAVGTSVALFPIVAYIVQGWGWRRHTIVSSLSTKAKNNYLNLYHRQALDEGTADKRFAEFYQKWFGRFRLVGPTIIIGIIVVCYIFMLSSYAAQQLFGISLINLVDKHGVKGIGHSLAIAAASIAGAYVLVSLDAIGRVVKRDLSAEDLYVYALRMMSCVPVAFALSSLVKDDAAMIVAFAVGGFPLQMVADMLKQNALKRLNMTQVAPEITNDLLTKLAGVDSAVFERMSNIGVSTIGQLSDSDPIQLTMRTNLAFTYLLDLTSQALAWNYLEAKLVTLRPMGLRGACELGVLNKEAHTDGSAFQANAIAVVEGAATAIGLTQEQFKNLLHQVADDPYTLFLIEAYG
jgi:hypothetical protein